MKWDQVKLKVVSILVGGYAFKSSNMTDTCLPNYLPVIKIGNVSISGTLDLKNVQYHKYTKDLEGYNIKVGDVLIAMTGATVGKVSISSQNDLLLNQRVGLIRPKKDVITQRYLHHALCNAIFYEYCQNTAGGGAQGNISPSQILEYSIPLPPLHIQEQIADTLDKADALRRKDQELLTKYDELAQAIFYDMFGDPVRNEKGWEVKKLKEISIKIHSGNTPMGGSNVYVEKGITFFRSQNVWKNRLDYDDIAYLDEKTHKSMSKSSLHHRDILMTKTGRINTENSSLGRAAIFLGNDNTANVNGHVYLIRLQKGEVNEFVLHILTTKEYRNLIREVCVGGIDKRQLNKDHIEQFPIIYPPLHLQGMFVNKLLLLQKQKNHLEVTAKESENLFNKLMNLNFS